MRQKLNSFKKQIRKNQIESYFITRRNQMAQNYNKREVTFVIDEPYQMQNQMRLQYQVQENYSIADGEDTMQNENDIYQFWKIDSQNLFQRVLDIMNEAYGNLKKVTSIKCSFRWKMDQIYKHFLRTPLLSNFVKSVILAYKNKCSVGLLQSMSKRVIDILQKVIYVQPLQFSQSVFLGSNLLILLGYCLDEPKFDYNHLSKIICIIIHMMTVSKNESFELFHLLNSKKNQSFNITSLFFNIQKINVKPTDQITINFIIMMRQYLSIIEDSVIQSKQKKNQSLKWPIILDRHQLDIVFEIAMNSYHCFVNSDSMDNDSIQGNQKIDNLNDSLQLLRLLIEYCNIGKKWLDRVNYLKMINLLQVKTVGYQIKLKILMILDHLIYADHDSNCTFTLVKSCELLPALWNLKNIYNGYVLNIFSNLACSESFKADISPYVHRIFMTLQYQSNNLHIYDFIYNWFSSQQFQIRESRDKLILEVLRKSTEINPKINEVQSLIWLRLIQNENVEDIPTRILQFNNTAADQIRRIIANNHNYAI